MKIIDFNKSLYELTNEFPELIDILADIGFLGVKNPILRNTVGKKMTIPEGAKKIGIPINEIKEKLKQCGFSFKECINHS